MTFRRNSNSKHHLETGNREIIMKIEKTIAGITVKKIGVDGKMQAHLVCR